MQSYHIEVLALKIFDGVLSDYSWNVFQFFEQAATLVQSSLPYEEGFADDYLADDDDREEVASRLESATDKARNAWYLTYNGRGQYQQAIEIWKDLFGDKFPPYG